MPKRLPIHIALVTLLVAGGCQNGGTSSGRTPATGPSIASETTRIATSLDRPDWMISQSSEVWKIYIGNEVESLAPEHAGYLVRNKYRKGGRGPAFEMYSVTSRNRNEQLGHIDSVGHAVRYEPVRNGTFRSVDVGAGTLEYSVGAIFETTAQVTLEPTTERRIAFERLDRDGSGALEGPELAPYGRTIIAADANGNGKIEPDEFEKVDL